jgi:hypothetical protein
MRSEDETRAITPYSSKVRVLVRIGKVMKLASITRMEPIK